MVNWITIAVQKQAAIRRSLATGQPVLCDQFFKCQDYGVTSSSIKSDGDVQQGGATGR